MATIRGTVDPVVLLQQLVKQFGSRAAAAEHLDISASYFGDILKGYKQPGPKILRELKLKRQLVYVWA